VGDTPVPSGDTPLMAGEQEHFLAHMAAMHVTRGAPTTGGLLAEIPRGSSKPPPQAAYSRALQPVADDGAVGNDVQGGGLANSMPPGRCAAPGVCATVDGASVIRLLPWMLRAAAMERERRRRGCGSGHTAPSR
jgi:hypothetical protein